MRSIVCIQVVLAAIRWIRCYVFLDFVVLDFLGSQSLYNFGHLLVAQQPILELQLRVR